MTIVTRFAPSPTGFLHIGGARTALFNFLLAKSKGGKYLLRIEDTDRARSTQEAIDAILDGLAWLGLEGDEAPVTQFARRERHQEEAKRLLDEGKAYRCWCSPEELQNMREKARAEGRPPRYDGTWRDRDPAEAPAGVDPVTRLRAPQDGETVIEDLVQGRVVFGNDQLDDMVLLRSDGTPTYMHAVVVDDHDMGVTHVLRGDDHLNNAARQTQLFLALGYAPPQFAHIPLIHGPDGAKLSKRHGALGVDAYRDMGILPEALRNYLLRLGWSHGDDEIIDDAQARSWFDLDHVGKAAARFDMAKLEHLNAHYLRERADEELAELIEARLAAKGTTLDGPRRERLLKGMEAAKARARTLLDLEDGVGFLIAQRPLALDAKAAKHLSEEGRAALDGLGAKVADLASFDEANLEALCRAHAGEKGLGFGKVAQPLRAALTGRAVSPGLFDVMTALGRSECVARIGEAVADRMR